MIDAAALAHYAADLSLDFDSLPPRVRRSAALMQRLAQRQAGSLGTYHGFSDRERQYRAPQPTWRTAGARAIDRHLRRHKADRRLEYCGSRTDCAPALVLNEAGTRARWAGVARCEAWDCPRCARSKADKAAGRLAAVVEAARERGWHAYFLTLTQAHTSHDTLQRCITAARAGWAAAKRAMRRHDDWRGAVSAVEVTLGRRGWHVHVHAIVWTVRPLEDGSAWDWSPAAQATKAAVADYQEHVDGVRARRCTSNTQRFAKRDELELAEDHVRACTVEALGRRNPGRAVKRGGWQTPILTAPRFAFETSIVDAWCDAVSRGGMVRPDWRRQDMRDAHVRQSELVRYVLKTAYEIAGAPYKRGRGASFAPAAILESAAGGCHQARRAWREYREATAGLHRLQGLPALEKKLAIEDENEPRPPAQFVLALDVQAYYAARNIAHDRLLVRICESEWLGGPTGARRMARRAGRYATAEDWRHAGAVELGAVRMIAAGVPVWDARGSAAEATVYTVANWYALREREHGHYDSDCSTYNGDKHRRVADRLAREITGGGNNNPRRLVTLAARRGGLANRRRDAWRTRISPVGEGLRPTRQPD